LAIRRQSETHRRRLSIALHGKQDILVRTVCRIILENRPAIYQAEGLEAFRSHGCEPANKQVLKLCREIVTMTGGDPAVINDLAKEVTAQRRAAKMDSSTASPQKRKHAAVKDEEGQTL
jgi:hypothetical protein